MLIFTGILAHSISHLFDTERQSPAFKRASARVSCDFDACDGPIFFTLSGPTEIIVRCLMEAPVALSKDAVDFLALYEVVLPVASFFFQPDCIKFMWRLVNQMHSRHTLWVILVIFAENTVGGTPSPLSPPPSPPPPSSPPSSPPPYTCTACFGSIAVYESRQGSPVNGVSSPCLCQLECQNNRLFLSFHYKST